MVLKGWLLLLLPLLFTVHAQDGTDTTCNKALGLSSGDVEDGSVSSPLGEDSTPAAGRLNKEDGAWCFTNDSIASHNAVLIIDLGYKRFVSGFGSQGPPDNIHPKTYNHFIGFSAGFSFDKKSWDEFNGGNLFFDTDKDDTSGNVSYHVSSTVEYTQYVKINVTMHISGSTSICLRFEIYGCDTTILPSTNVQALTTPKGKIEVSWKKPTVETSLEPDIKTFGVLTPDGYAVLYKPAESQSYATVASNDRTVSLEDVRLGATYVVQLKCIFKDKDVSCGSAEIEAYPPCPESFTGGNEYHCFLYLNSVSSFSEARSTCLNSQFDQQLGGLGYLVDEEERTFLVTRILPEGESELWLIGDKCQENENCCKLLKIQDGMAMEDEDCSDKILTSALCVRDHKGEGARLRVSSVEAADDGSSALFIWKYEGVGWKTDELQVRIWTSSQENNPPTHTFSTLSNSFKLNVDVGVIYSLLLMPAPNIRSEEFVYRFIIIDFQENTAKHGAVLTPIPMSIYIIWSGSIRVTWEDAKAVSKSGTIRLPDKYSITSIQESVSSEVEIESGREFVLTPIMMKAMYVFKISCFFVDVFHPCGEISITTDPPNLVLFKPSKVYIIYEVIPDKLKTWLEAENDCQERAGHLTSLLDDAEAKALLKMLPNKDSKMWTGAKLGKKGTGYWTDGQKITDLPMAKNSGVTSSSESCCKAINEMGKLKFAGSNCEDRYPYICKYTVEKMMVDPSDIQASDFQWESFTLSWMKPKERWLPTFYNIRACVRENPTNCIVKKEFKDKWQTKFESLLEFRSYKVEIEAVLQPVEVKTMSEISVMTYPKSPVKVSISPKGEGYVNTPMLTALGFPSASVTATLFQMDLEIGSFNGGVKDLPISGFVPEETYKIVVKHDDGDWSSELTFPADPTCLAMDVLVDSTCYTLVEEPEGFENAKKQCSESPENKENPSLWLPSSKNEIRDVVKNLGPFLNSWAQKPTDGSDSEINVNCSKGDGSCCFYDVSSAKILCSSCCDEKLPFICSYRIKESYIGKVENLLPKMVGNTSIGIAWNAPEGISWKIRRFEVEWLDVENSKTVGKDVVIGVTDKLMDELEYGTEYEILVTPLGAMSVRGETDRILITTLDPRTPISADLEPNGYGSVYSPLLIAKGRGSETVTVRVFKWIDKQAGDKKFMFSSNGQAQKVEISGLELGKEYNVEMTSTTQVKPFNYSTDVLAYPSCQENQIQDGFVCLWAPQETKTWKEAYEVCKSKDGQLLDYKTQEKLTQPVKARLTSYIHTHFWLDMGSEGSSALRDANTSDCQSAVESEVLCCSYELSEEGELNNLKCTCCDEPRPFACKKTAKILLGEIGDFLVEDVTSRSLRVSWTMKSTTNWQKPSFLITWNEISTRKKRSVDNQLVTNDSPASIEGLKPGTKYRVAVAPYTDVGEVSGDSKEVSVTTREDITIAGLMDPGCSVIIFKISCCVAVILGSSFTVFVFIAARMLYLDCIAQIFSELGTLGAYICILISSAQSYNDDSLCRSADPTLCVAVSVLIQFFFQVIYLFIFQESLLICSVLKDYLPSCCNVRSLLGMSISGFGIPAIMMIILAAVASEGFSDREDNCWLDLEGEAMLPSVIPVIIFGAVACFLILSAFTADEPKDGLSTIQRMRGRIYLKSRWGCFLILTLTSICYATGMIGANNRDETLNYVFAGCSIALGILMPIIRIRFDDEVREILNRGLFNSLKDDLGAIRVSPAPDDKYDPHPLLSMSEFESRKFKQKQLEELKTKESLNLNTQAVWHQ